MRFRRRSRERSSSGAQAGRRRRWFGDSEWRRNCLGAINAVLVAAEQAKNGPLYSRSAWCQQSCPSCRGELLADALVRGPLSTARSRRGQPDRREHWLCREVGDFDIYLPRPHLAGHLCEWGNGALGEVPIPLGPSRLLAIGEVEGVDDATPLPAVVRRRVALGQRRRAWVGVLDPASAHGDRCHVERHVSLRLGPRGLRSGARPSGSRLVRCGRSACRRRARGWAC
jgi:hypothetical protein